MPQGGVKVVLRSCMDCYDMMSHDLTTCDDDLLAIGV